MTGARFVVLLKGETIEEVGISRPNLLFFIKGLRPEEQAGGAQEVRVDGKQVDRVGRRKAAQLSYPNTRRKMSGCICCIRIWNIATAERFRAFAKPNTHAYYLLS